MAVQAEKWKKDCAEILLQNDKLGVVNEEIDYTFQK